MTSFRLGNRQVFKISIGEAARTRDDYLFDEALKTGYVLLGWGDLVDWTPARFGQHDEMISEWQQHMPRGEVATAKTGQVKFPYTLRNRARIGDLIVVSKGLRKFRAIGEIIGDYEFSPRTDDDKVHRRRVRWLWIDRSGEPVDKIYSKQLAMSTIYLLDRDLLNIRALEACVDSARGITQDDSPDSPIPPIPKQGLGLHYSIDSEGVIDIAPPHHLDSEGNNIHRMEMLQPALIKHVKALLASLSTRNEPLDLEKYLVTYLIEISKPLQDVNVTLLFVEGVQVSNAATEALVDFNKDQLHLDVGERSGLATLLQVHGAFMMCTSEGAQAVAEESRFARNPDQEQTYRDALIKLVDIVSQDPRLVTPKTDKTGHLFIECKTKRLTLGAKTLSDTTALDKDLVVMAEAIVQHYGNIRRALEGKTRWVPNGLPVYPMILTLEDWYVFSPRVSEMLKGHVHRLLGVADIPASMLDEMPWVIASSHEFEITTQVMARVGIHTVMDGKVRSGHRNWSLLPFVSWNFPDEMKQVNRRLFPEDWARLIPDESEEGKRLRSRPS